MYELFNPIEYLSKKLFEAEKQHWLMIQTIQSFKEIHGTPTGASYKFENVPRKAQSAYEQMLADLEDINCDIRQIREQMQYETELLKITVTEPKEKEDV